MRILHMVAGGWQNLIAMYLAQVDGRGDRPFLWEKHAGAYHPMSWRESAERIARLARALIRNGLKPGARVILLAENSPRWVIADFAIMAAGGVTVPVYTTNTVDDHAHILSDSGAMIAIVSTSTLARPFLEAAEKAGDLEHIISVEQLDRDHAGRASISTWQDALEQESGETTEIAERASRITADELACLIYTSGTGGRPKGVMLSHRAVMANCAGATDVLADLGLADEVFLSFLPLSHAYEHTAGLMFPVSIGAEIYFAERIDTLTTNLTEAKPTVMTAVPRLYEVMRERILHGLREQSALRTRLFWMTVSLGRKHYEAPETMTAWERLADRIVDKLVRNKVRARFGGRLKALVSGGAPLNYDVGVFFTALGLRLLQGYGQTEAAPVITCNRCTRIKLRTVGPPLKDTEIRIADDGEILARGPMLMDGYWNLPDLSAEVLRDGWLHTGDIGVIDADGYLQITDRKKDIIVNSGGDNIAPQHVESILALEADIAAAMVVGDGRPHLAAIVVPSPDFIADWAKSYEVEPDLSQLAKNGDFHHALSAAVDRANKKLSSIERVKRFMVADAEFQTSNELMTPTMKPRRHAIVKRWGDAIDALF